MVTTIRRLQPLALVVAALTVVSCRGGADSSSGRSSASRRAKSEPWVRVFADTNLTIALDTTRLERISGPDYTAWFETRWAHPRYGEKSRTPSPFNQELIHVVLRCEPLSSKLIHITVTLDGGPPVAEQGKKMSDTASVRWEEPPPGSADQGAFVKACAIIHGEKPAQL